MKIDFDFNAVASTEFGVGLEEGDQEVFQLVTVDADVQRALQEMVAATVREMRQASEDPSPYEPAEKYSSQEHVILPLEDELARQLRDLHEANNLRVDSQALAEPAKIFCYFSRMTDKKARRLTALHRAGQFKGVLKSRLIRVVTDALKLIEDNVFKLDSDFDLLVDNKNIRMLRPSAFEFVGKLQDVVSAAAPANLKEIQADMPFVDFANVEDYAKRHPRAARYLASIRSQKETKNIDRRALKRLCKATGVPINEVNGKIAVQRDEVMDFLEVLDRRRYAIKLVKNSPERVRAASRKKIPSQGP